jgi:hypothetical protein
MKPKQQRPFEIAARTLAGAKALAARYGCGEPDFIHYCGNLCVLRYEQAQANQLASSFFHSCNSCRPTHGLTGEPA